MNEENIKRLLPVEGVFNMRDLGGYKTTDNATVKWRTIIRSGDMTTLTDEGLEYLSALPLKTIVDLRSLPEREAMPDKAPLSVQEEVWLPIDAGDLSRMKPDGGENVLDIMSNVYRSIIRRNQSELQQFFRLIEDENKVPLLFHCSAGKDRTGIASALFLSALGVDRETIIEDYLLSSEYIKGKYDFLVKMYPALEPLVTVRREYLEAAFQVIDEEYNGIENFLKNALQVDILKLRDLYLE